MGWLYYAATKKALIADRTTAWETDGVRRAQRRSPDKHHPGELP